MRLRLISLFAGIEGFGLGFERAGCEVVAQVEIEGFCNSLLVKHHPEVPRFGDIRGVKGSDLPPADIVVGGVPCQDWSVAGRRAGLAGARSGLFFEFARLVAERRPRWLVFENVFGLLSSPPGRGGEDFATVLGELTGFYPEVPAGGWRNSGICVGPRYGVAWRVLDAEYFGLAQRRERVFIVGHSGGAARAAQVLFEPESCDGDSPPSREKGAEVAGTLGGGSGRRGWRDDLDRATFIPDPGVAHALTARHDSSEDGTGRGSPLIVHENLSGNVALADHARSLRAGASHSYQVVFDPTQITSPGNYSSPRPGDPCHPLAAGAGPPILVNPIPLAEIGKRCDSKADKRDGLGVGGEGDPMFTLQAGARHGVAGFHWQAAPAQSLGYIKDGVPSLKACTVAAVCSPSFVRRLTPRECERLQGFPDDYTLLDENTRDSPRYRALGNAVAVPVVKWIAERLVWVDSLPDKWWKEARP